MIKVDLHTHTSDDPEDVIPYTAIGLIDRAAELGFGAIAITLHNRQFDVREVADYARERGIALIAGLERTLCGKHVLLLNFPARAAESVETLADLAELRRRHAEGLVVAPHPFYPAPTCLRGVLDRHPELFDAVEVNAFHTRGFDFNRAAIHWAHRFDKPLVGNSDVHRLPLFGATFSLVDAVPDAHAICAAIKAGRVEVHRRPLSHCEAARYFTSLMLAGCRGRRVLPAPRRFRPNDSHGCLASDGITHRLREQH